MRVWFFCPRKEKKNVICSLGIGEVIDLKINPLIWLGDVTERC